jgi:hypothetical protein
VLIFCFEIARDNPTLKGLHGCAVWTCFKIMARLIVLGSIRLRVNEHITNPEGTGSILG